MFRGDTMGRNLHPLQLKREDSLSLSLFPAGDITPRENSFSFLEKDRRDRRFFSKILYRCEI